MAAFGALRRIGDPVVARAPTGVRIRTRIYPTAEQAQELTAIGHFLGSLYRSELAQRTRCGVLDRRRQAAWRAGRKQALTAVSSSRWAGVITRAVEHQYQLGMRALAAHEVELRHAVEVLEQRCALRPGELQPVDDNVTGRRERVRRRGLSAVGSRVVGS
ncbi:MAG TPA: hypothetical protein VGA66_07005 [Mycobacterium sp.]